MYIVTTMHKGAKFWLRSTTWSFSEDRAQVFETPEAALAQLEKSRKFNAAAAFKNAVVEPKTS
jgi:hypothetical protein